MTSEQLTIEAIAGGMFEESEALDFKRELNLGTEQERIRFVDDVVAFLNRGPAHILVGIAEKAGRFESFRPCTQDRDKARLQILSIIQDCVTPAPLDIKVNCLDLEGGYVLDIQLPRHGSGPYQNRLTGAFLIRTSVKNTPIGRDALKGYFADEARWTADLVSFAADEAMRVETSGRMTDQGPILQIGILPRQHYDASVGHFTQSGPVRWTAPHYGEGASVIFRGCEGGNEAFVLGGDGKGITRLFVRDDWFVHAHIAWPIWLTSGEGRLTLHEFKTELPAYLTQLAEFFEQENIAGPFIMMMGLSALRRNDKLAWAFREIDTVRLPRAQQVHNVADEALINSFFGLVERSTVWN